MRAEIHHFHSPDADPLDKFRPSSREEAGALIEMMMNPEGEPGEESFQVVVGTAEYIATLPDQRFTWVVDEWDWAAIKSELTRRVAAAEGETWTGRRADQPMGPVGVRRLPVTTGVRIRGTGAAGRGLRPQSWGFGRRSSPRTS